MPDEHGDIEAAFERLFAAAEVALGYIENANNDIESLDPYGAKANLDMAHRELEGALYGENHKETHDARNV